MKRKVGGWVLFIIGIFFIGTCINILITDYLGWGITLKTLLEMLVTAVPGALALWGGWKLAHPKPKLIY